ncbi:MAG: 2-oxoacid:ferredoxin oxidoreductase subunit beta [Thermoprotei archaeon]|nr:MAG: 2-oxoacid:ferredoxin oxidoreductase subunit beta [Thermoprotei archaeon]
MSGRYGTSRKIVWCPGCGNFAILTAFKNALANLGLKPEKVVAVSGIGCHGRITDYLNVNGFHTIHGRVLPLATGIKLANPELVVVGFAGDGDAYAIGIGHLPHAARRNVDITYIVHDNMVFGLTTGQFTPTTPYGMRTRSSPRGTYEEPINPILFALSIGASFVARGFAGDVKHLTYLIEEAIKHRGFAFIDVLQPCVTFYNTYAYYRQRVYKLEDEGHDYTSSEEALRKAREWGDKIPIGIFYKASKPTFSDRKLKDKDPPVHVKPVNIAKLYKPFM